MKATYNEHCREARKRTRHLIKRHRPEQAMDDVLAKALDDADRVVAMPRPGEAHETPALTEAGRAAEATEEADRAEAETPATPAGAKIMAGVRWLTQQEA